MVSRGQQIKRSLIKNLSHFKRKIKNKRIESKQGTIIFLEKGSKTIGYEIDLEFGSSADQEIIWAIKTRERAERGQALTR